MYTDKMKKAFRSISAPKNFSVEIYDNENFLSIKIDPKKILNLTHDDKLQAMQYLFSVKKALEENGAIVLITRDAIDGK